MAWSDLVSTSAPPVAAICKAALALVLSALMFVPELPNHFPMVVIAGFCGGLVRFIAERERFWPTGLGTIITGMVTAAFLWPVGQPWVEGFLDTKLSLEPVTAAMFGGFVTGVMGVSLIGLILDFTRARREKVNAERNDD